MTNRTATAKFIDQQNAAHQVVIYAKSYCPHCQPTKKLFQSMPGVQVKVFNLDHEMNGILMQQVLLAKTGQRTVPNVFVNNHHVGGNDQVQQAFRDGTLKQMLNLKADDNNRRRQTPQEKLRQLIQKENDNHQVVVWSKSYCPYCRATKKVFAGEPDIDIVVHEMDELDHGDLLQQELQAMTGQRTVPNVFVNGKHVGGNSDIQELARSGGLRKMLFKKEYLHK